MPLGPGTQVVDGQRNTFPTSYAYRPTQYGPQTTGVPNVSPSMPPFLGGSSGGGSGPGGMMSAVGGYGTADNNTLVAQVANAHPFNLKVSPVLWAVGLLILSILLINGIHWRRVTLEGAEEHGHVGGVSEEAREEAA